MKKILLLLSLSLVQLSLVAQIDTTDLLFYSTFDGTFDDLSKNEIRLVDSNITFTTDRFDNPNSAIYSSISSYPPNVYLSIIDSNYFKNIYENDFTISVWIKYAGDGSYSIGHIIKTNDLQIRNSQYIDFGNFSWNDPNKPDFSEWHHFVWTTMGDSIVEYLNSEPVRKRHKSTASNSFNNSKHLLLQELNGSADDLVIFKRSLNQSEINTLYSTNNVITGVSSKLDKNPLQIPNPISGKISLPENYEVVSLTSITGQVQIESKSNILSLYNVPSGLYMLKIRKANNYFTQKIIVK